jgi:hypothetical protein
MNSIEPGGFSRLQRALGAWCCGLLVACGGGGDGPGAQVAAPPAAPAAPAAPAPSAVRDFGLLGAFGGTFTGTDSQDIILVMDGIGNLWAVYGTDAANEFKVAGLLSVWGSSTSTATQYRSDDAVDWGAALVQIELSLDPAIPMMAGVVTSDIDTRTIAGGALPASGYQLAVPPRLETVRGHWDLTTSQGRQLSIDIAADGAISGTSGQCVLRDSAIKPSVSGNNVFALAMSFGGQNCTEPHAGSDGVYGFALAYAPIGGGLQLVIGAWNGWDPVYLAAAGKR